MLNQIQKKGRFERGIVATSNFTNSWFGKHIIKPLLVSLVPFLAVSYLRLPAVKTYIDTLIPSSFPQFISENTAILYLCAFAYAYLALALLGLLSSGPRNKNEIDARGFMALWKTTDQVVSAKHDRFCSTAKKILKNKGKQSQGEIFAEITKPEQQIALLMERIKDLFEYFDYDNETTFRVRLIQIDNGLPVDWFYYTPQSEFPTTTLDELKNSNSALGKCLKTKRIVITEDISSAAKRNEYVSNNNDENGSLICYPVISSVTSSIVYVISVRADTNKYFLSSRREFYTWVFKHFTLRINLEHSLLMIKESISNEPNSR